MHRDFTPSNILVSVTGDVKLIDFGIAKAEHNRSQTRSGVIKGKVKYMSPEQTEGKRLGRRSDVFSAGVVLYECLVGRPPFLAPEDPLLMEAIREAHPDPVSASHPELIMLSTCNMGQTGPRADTPGFIARCRALAIPVEYWTINDPAEAERLLALGADGIMTDDPAAIAPVFRRRRATT